MEVLRENVEVLCNVDTIVIDDGTKIKAFRMACRMWECEECMPIRLWQLKQLAKDGKPVSMITLTASPDTYDTPDEMAQALVRGWRVVLQRGKRHGMWTNPQYLAVFEEHKSGWPHLHILWRGPYIPQDWLSDRMREYANGPIVWISKIYNEEQAADYVAKYVSKGPHRYDGCKRYWRSMGWLTEEAKRRREATQIIHYAKYIPDDIAKVAWELDRYGWSVEIDETGSLSAERTPYSTWPWLNIHPPDDIPHTDYKGLVGKVNKGGGLWEWY